MDSDVEESLKKRPRKSHFPSEFSRKNFMQEEDIGLDTIRARFSNVLKRHGELTERLSRYFVRRKIVGIYSSKKETSLQELDIFSFKRDSDKMILERLTKEFEAARAAQTQEILLDGEQWNDGLLATIRERVHMDADRKALTGESNKTGPHCQERITYKVGSKVILCLEGARIGIQYETSFAGEPCELYHCVLESKSFLEKMIVLEHTVPFFLPLREAENDLLSSNAMKFIDYIGELLQSFVDRREQVRLVKDLYGNQIGELYHSVAYHMIEFALDDFDCKVTVMLRYADLLAVLPTRIKVLAWPTHSSKKSSMNTLATTRKENGSIASQPGPTRLSYAEDALRSMSLPEAYAEIVLNLPRALQQIYQQRTPT